MHTLAINPQDPLMRPDDVAEYLGVKKTALDSWRQYGKGPTYIKVGHLVRYKQSALDAWVAARTVSPDV